MNIGTAVDRSGLLSSMLARSVNNTLSTSCLLRCCKMHDSVLKVLMTELAATNANLSSKVSYSFHAVRMQHM